MQAAARLIASPQTPQAQERLLGRVLRGFGVAEQAGGEAHQAALVRLHDQAERLRVPLRRPPHQGIVIPDIIHRPSPPLR